jgi:hypothetical protein
MKLNTASPDRHISAIETVNQAINEHSFIEQLELAWYHNEYMIHTLAIEVNELISDTAIASSTRVAQTEVKPDTTQAMDVTTWSLIPFMDAIDATHTADTTRTQ